MEQEERLASPVLTTPSILRAGPRTTANPRAPPPPRAPQPEREGRGPASGLAAVGGEPPGGILPGAVQAPDGGRGGASRAAVLVPRAGLPSPRPLVLAASPVVPSPQDPVMSLPEKLSAGAPPPLLAKLLAADNVAPPPPSSAGPARPLAVGFDGQIDGQTTGLARPEAQRSKGPVATAGATVLARPGARSGDGLGGADAAGGARVPGGSAGAGEDDVLVPFTPRLMMSPPLGEDVAGG
ncbi:expressed protein, partial [Baffinella frigidus]